MSVLVLFVSVLAALALGFPVAFTLGGVSLIIGLIFLDTSFIELMPLRIWGTMTNQILLSVPLFVSMGLVLQKSGIAEELLTSASSLFGRKKAGLAYAVILVGAILAASTGIVGATVVTMGLISLPTMLKQGYRPELAMGTIAASGTLGQIIPPSVILVLLGSVLSVSVGDLFLGALVPGLILVVIYLVYISVLAKFFPGQVRDPLHQELLSETSQKEVVHWTVALLSPLILIVAVLGSIFSGIASPTEASGVGAGGAILLAAIRKKISKKDMGEIARQTTLITSMVFTILIGASAFSLVFRGLGGDVLFTSWLTSTDLSPHAFLWLVMAVIFVAGFFIDFIEIIFIIVPVILPMLQHLKIDLLWFGVLMAVNLQTSFLTPPFGFALFYLKGVAPPSVTTRQLYKGVIPYILLQVLLLVLVYILPELVTYLPRHR